MGLPQPLDGALLADDVVAALQLAATRRTGPVTTFDLLLATIDTDGYGDWSSVQIASTYVTGDDAARFPDPAAGAGGTWERVPLTPTATAALATARRVAETYKLFPLPPGVLALGLVADSASGAARALLAESDLNHAQLIEVIEDDVLGSTLEELADVLALPGGAADAGAARADTAAAGAATSGDEGWGPDWQLFETPETRRLDAQAKAATAAEAVLLCAFCLQLVTQLVVKTGVWSILLIPAALALTFAVGPPRRSPLTCILRVLLAGALHSGVMVVTAWALMAFEAVDYYYVTPRLLAAGRGGALPSARTASRIRVSGLRDLRADRFRRFLDVAEHESAPDRPLRGPSN